MAAFPTGITPVNSSAAASTEVFRGYTSTGAVAVAVAVAVSAAGGGAASGAAGDATDTGAVRGGDFLR